MTGDTSKDFFKRWNVYQKIMDCNYLYHKRVYELLHDFFMVHFISQFSLLDLGCGDAEFMSKALGETLIKNYYGVDLSTVALDIAKKNLELLKCKKNFINDDFTKAIKEIDVKFDAIWIGLSLHHLTTEQKKVFIADCRKRIVEGGYFIFFEPVMKVHEKRDEFLKRWKEICEKKWTKLSKDEMKQICDHVVDFDYPETVDKYKKLAQENGFEDMRIIYEDPEGLYKMLCFR